VSRRRDKPDGLPFRVYERKGARIYSIGYKDAGGKWRFRLTCSVRDTAKVAETRRDAIRLALQIAGGAPSSETFAALVDAWFDRQERLPLRSPLKRADSTLAENRREAENLKKSFGDMRVQDIEKSDAYAYLDACLMAVDPETMEPRPRPEKGNKEISLARTILEFGVRIGKIKTNPFADVERLVTQKANRYVSDAELALSVEVGRRMGASQHIVALALKTAYLCVRRSVEVRALTRAQITDQGITWLAAKRQRGEAEKVGLIEWSDELRATIDEALAIKRSKVAGTWYVFGNLRGQRYTKGGWKATLSKLMNACEAEAKERGQPFRKFSLQDCRPKAVSDKLARGDADVVDATMHSSERMVRQVYDRRRVRIARPAK
jgi:integrase